MSADIVGLEKIWIDTDSGKIESWFVPPAGEAPKKPFPMVICAHGNAELIDFWPQDFRKFSEMGLGMLLVEYPGYGRSAGSPSQQSITEAFIAAYDIIVSRKDVDPSKIIFFGRSLGGGVICSLAEKRPSAAFVLMSTFISARSFASRYLVPSFLVRDPFHNDEIVSNYTGPVLIIHGIWDNIIPYAHGKTLYQIALHGKMITYNCAHNDCPPNWEVFWKDIESFLLKIELIKRKL